ncbi:MAG: shikimate dehydrogenase, partial [Pseudomonadota bacterium]
LGAGGASRAVVHGLLSAGFTEVRIANRTLERALTLSDRFGKSTSAHGLGAVPELLGDSDVLVNTTSIGMKGENSGSLPSLDAMPDHGLVTDIVYTPLITPLLANARDRGLETVDGLGMLFHQAVPGFEKWFGKRPKVTQALRKHILETP